MERVRAATLAAVLVVLSIVGVAVGSAIPSATLNSTSWPIATLLLSEVQTGGASASDEFIELTNAGPSIVDLAGLEVVYVTSTGGTITRKATWAASQPLEPGRHLLIVNSAGAYVSIGDLSYSSGLAATGGTVVLRLVAGAPIDAVGWGDATNSFIETTRAPAPPTSSSLERLPGGLAGNTTDTNDNAADWFVQASPNPQGLAAPPVPAPPPSPSPAPSSSPTPPASGSPGASAGATDEPSGSASSGPSVSPSEPSSTPTPTPAPSPTVGPSPTASDSPGSTPTPSPTPSPSSNPTQAPSPSPAPSPTPSPSPTATPTPTPTAPPSPTPSPSASPSPTPDPTVSIAAARAQANDSQATISGVLTTELGALDSGRVGFVQDDTAGIALYLDALPAVRLPAGTVIRIAGTLTDRYAARTLRVSLADIVVLGQSSLPDPLELPTGSLGEAVEGQRVQVIGTTVGSPTSYADGLGILVDDGSGSVRAIVGPSALGSLSLPSGTRVAVLGPVGQRDSSGTGTTAYRIHATEPGELQVLPAPTPSASPSPSASNPPTPAPTATPVPSPSGAGPGASATPSPPPTASPAPTTGTTLISIRDARSRPVGSSVIVAGVVSAEVGRIGSTSVVALADASGGLLVRVPTGTTAPARGSALQVSGPIAAPYGQVELRPLAPGVRETGTGEQPWPLRVSAADLGEATEGRLVELVGTATSVAKRSTTGDLSIELLDPAGATFRVMATAASGLVIADLPVGRPLRVVGIVGQRASRTGALDGYRIWLRDRADVRVEAGPGSGDGSAAGGGTTPTAPGAIGIATALVQPDGTGVLIDATVTANASLLDTSGRRIVVEDGSGAIEVLLPDDSAVPAIGTRLLIDGRTAHAWGAPRLRANTVTTLAGGGQIPPASRTTPPGEAQEWRLVRVSGTISKVERLGDRWRAELLVGGSSGPAMPILGQAGAAIPSTAVIVGRSVTITGIVKRPYPTATDQRFAILPRSQADLASGPSGSGGGSVGGAGAGRVSGSGAPGGSTGAGTTGPGAGGYATDVTPDTDLAALLPRLGQRVRVGGLIAAISESGFDLDDGTAIAPVMLRADARELLPYLRVSDAIAASGTVERIDGTLVVVVEAAGDLVRVGDLGQAMPIGPSASPGPSAEPGSASLADTVSSVLQPQPGPLGLVAMAVLSLASLVGTLLRRRRARRLLREVITARLATLRPTNE